MSVLFENSNTKINLMKAFAGESQARNRYAFAASQAEKEGLYVLKRVFKLTSKHEKAHAKLFYNKLKPFSDGFVSVSGDYPVNIYESTIGNLKAAQANEYAEYNDVYKTFSDEAVAEGFDDIAELFRKIATVEKSHGDRFEKMLGLVESGKLFVSDREETWICLKCGNVHKGKTAPDICPICEHGQGYQIRQDWISLF